MGKWDLVPAIRGTWERMHVLVYETRRHQEAACGDCEGAKYAHGPSAQLLLKQLNPGHEDLSLDVIGGSRAG